MSLICDGFEHKIVAAGVPMFDLGGGFPTFFSMSYERFLRTAENPGHNRRRHSLQAGDASSARAEMLALKSMKKRGKETAGTGLALNVMPKRSVAGTGKRNRYNRRIETPEE